MKWILDITGILLVTTMSGGLLFALWYAAVVLLDRTGYPDMACRILRISALFFIVPVTVPVLLAVDNVLTGGFVLESSTSIRMAAFLIFALWLAGMAAGFLKWIHVYDSVKRHIVCRVTAGSREQRIFDQVCSEIGIKPGEVTLMICRGVPGPILWGMKDPEVIIPDMQLEDDELRAVFAHELTHYLHRDVLMGYAAMCVRCIHFFNPAAHLYLRAVSRWSEYICDKNASALCGGEKAYCAAVIDIHEKCSFSHSLAVVGFDSGNDNELLWRMKKMLDYTKAKKMAAAALPSYGVAAAALAVLLTLSGLMVTCLSGALSQSYSMIVWGDPASAAEQMEGTQTVSADKGIKGEVVYSSSLVLEADSIMKTEDVTVADGGRVAVYVSMPDEFDGLTVGVIMPDGSKLCMAADTSAYYCFDAEQGGEYGVYFLNSGGGVFCGAYSCISVY